METNIDDCSGEMLGFVMEQLLGKGALDVFFTSIFMKKNRPAYRLTVVCNEEKMDLLQKVIFTQTTTIGIRYRKEQRTILERKIKEIDTPLGKLQVKEVLIDGEKRCYPEYESAKKLAVETGKPLWEILNHEGKSGELV